MFYSFYKPGENRNRLASRTLVNLKRIKTGSCCHQRVLFLPQGEIIFADISPWQQSGHVDPLGDWKRGYVCYVIIIVRKEISLFLSLHDVKQKLRNVTLTRGVVSITESLRKCQSFVNLVLTCYAFFFLPPPPYTQCAIE